MPAPSLHLPLAYETLRALPTLSHEDLPAFLYGSVSPDVAQLLGRPRGETHFWAVGNDISGALKLLKAHPQLAAGRLTASERVFVAGYLAHLVADEQWTFCLWRPYFGLHSPYRGGPDGAALQNAYRDWLDEAEWKAHPSTSDLGGYLKEAASVTLRPDLLPFLRLQDLQESRRAIAELCELPPGPDRRRHVARTMRATFVEDDPTYAPRRAQALSYVRSESLSEFRERSVNEGVRLVGDYLAGRPLRPPLGTETPPDAT
jgi:hypothetical protein